MCIVGQTCVHIIYQAHVSYTRASHEHVLIIDETLKSVCTDVQIDHASPLALTDATEADLALAIVAASPSRAKGGGSSPDMSIFDRALACDGDEDVEEVQRPSSSYGVEDHWCNNTYHATYNYV